MKNIVFILLMCCFLQVNSQDISFPKDFTNKEIKNLNQLNLSLKTYSFDDVNFNIDLKELAYFNKKRKQNKAWSYVLSGTGAFLIATGIAIDSKKDLHGFKSLMYVNGALYLGTSIPFFVGNINNKKKMKKKLIFVEEKLVNLK